MGLFSIVASFVAGYVAGMRVGDKPLAVARGVVDDARRRATELAPRAGEMRARAMRSKSRMTGTAARGSGSTVDIRDVREVMTAAPETVGTDTTLRDAAAIMERADIGSVIVTDGDQIRGIVTDRDITVRAVAAGRDAMTTKVADVMTSSPATVSASATVQEAIDVMKQHNIRRVPVVEGGRPIGIVSFGDLATTAQARSLLEDISTAPPNN